VSGAEEAARFLGALLAGVPVDDRELFFYGWTLRDKTSHWFPVADGVQPAAERLVELADHSDVYIGVSLANEPLGARNRVRSELSAGIVGLWADIDIADPDVHKKFNLPPDIDSAMELLGATGVTPSIVIHSGHGLQAWWLFREPLIFESEEDRQEAAALAEGWNTTLRVKAAEHGWTVDSTFDLARVMRIPGTMNRKGNPPVDVVFHIDESGLAYDPSEIEEFFVGEERLKELGIKATRTYVVGELELDPDAKIDGDKFMLLTEADPKFDSTWKEDRKDLNKVDGSPSQYDMSMVSQLVMVGWNDQEIVNACIHRRRARGHDLKLRQDYWKRTLSKARENAAVEWSEENLEDQVAALEEAQREGDDEMVREKRREVLDSLSAQIGYEITNFVKYVGDPPSFDLRTPSGTVHFADAAQFTAQAQFTSKFWSITGFKPPGRKPGPWNNIVNLFGSIWEEQDIGVEATETGLMTRHVENYLDVCTPDAVLEQAVGQGFPFLDDEGRVYISTTSFKQFLWTTHGERVNLRDIGRLFSRMGFEQSTLNVTINGKRTSRGMWRVEQE
jgi:hypothetical protein